MNVKNFFVGRAVGLLVVVVLVGVIAALYALGGGTFEKKQPYALNGYKDIEYVIEGRRVRLQDGVSETEAAPGSASKIVTRYFGNELVSDLNDDGRDDVVFLLTQQSGGSGTMYYVVAALATEQGYAGSEGFLLGDRIAPQTTEKGSGKIVIINYADRAPGESFSVAPSVARSRWLLLDPETKRFGEVDQDFEGEADPSKMTLDMKTWVWVSALYNDGREVRPASGKKFTLTFNPGGKFSATTDCNTLQGTFKADGSAVSFSEMSSTKMYCQGSQEGDFKAILEHAGSYHFTSRGELILDIKFDSGSAVFR